MKIILAVSRCVAGGFAESFGWARNVSLLARYTAGGEAPLEQAWRGKA